MSLKRCMVVIDRGRCNNNIKKLLHKVEQNIENRVHLLKWQEVRKVHAAILKRCNRYLYSIIITLIFCNINNVWILKARNVKGY